MKITINYELADEFLIKQLSEDKSSSFLKKQQTLTLDVDYNAKDIFFLLEHGASYNIYDGLIVWNIDGEVGKPIKDKTDLDDIIKSLKFKKAQELGVSVDKGIFILYTIVLSVVLLVILSNPSHSISFKIAFGVMPIFMIIIFSYFVFGRDKMMNGNSVEKVYHYNGNLLTETPFINGKKHGVVKTYLKNGVLERETPYKDNLINGVVKDYYENGNLEAEISYINNKREGVCKIYYENGNLWFEIPYKNDLIDGVKKVYHEDGKLGYKVPYKYGIKSGIEERFYI